MNVSYVIDSLAAGGAENMLLRQIQHSEREPTVYKLGGSNDLEQAFSEAGASVIDIGDLTEGYFNILTRLYHHLNSEAPDILHAHLPTSQVVGRISGTIAGIDHIVSTHHNVRSSDAYQSLSGKLELLTRPLDDVEIAVSKAVRDSHTSAFGDPEWQVVYNAIDVESYRAKISSSDKLDFQEYDPIFLNIGRYVEQKGQVDLIRAMPAVLNEVPDAAVLIVGWGDLHTQLEDLAEEKGVADRVFVTGKVPSVYEYYATADIFVLPSRWEGFGIVLLEAMAGGIPIVSSDVSGISEVVTDEFGTLVPPQSPRELATAMKSMVDSDLEKLGTAALQRAHEKFSIEQMVRQQEAIYSDLV